MTDSTVNTKVPVLTVAEDMDSRRIFSTVTDAENYLNKCAADFSDFATTPLAAVGLPDGEFDPTIYTDGMEVMVATLRKAKAGIKAIVVAPVPSLNLLLADSAGRDWIKRIIEKELNHVAVRSLREAEDISTVVDQIPTTMAAYISSARESSGIMDTFNELYKSLNSTLSAKIPVWAKARLVKGELKKCLESKGYSDEYYPALENRGEGKDSLFVVALNLGIAGAKAKGMDATIFERWAATRNAKAFTPGQADTEEDDFDIGDLSAEMMKADAPATPVTPAAAA